MQEDLCRDERRRHLVDEMLPTLKYVIEQFLQQNKLVVFTQYWLPADDSQFRRFGDQYCIEDTPGAEIINELLPYREQVTILKKRKHSAFFDTPLDDVLRERQVETLGIAGLQTHICIMTTAADASFRSFRPVVLDNCVVSSTATKKSQALDWIATYVGAVEPAGTFLEQHLGQ
jgi:nicotinamidase-related amidase